MVDARRDPDDWALPEAVVAPKRRRGPQLIWIIPLVAALVGAWLAVKAVLDRGPTISIAFKTGEGLQAGKTRLKYKDVEIGLVTSIVLARDNSGVVAEAELAKDTEHLLVEDTALWVVRPRVSGGSVSGLGTLLGGAYVGVDPGKSPQAQRKFVGLETPPVVTLDVPGRYFVLRADDLSSVDVASPIYFRRVPVGQVVSYAMDGNGEGVSLKVFVQAPYDQYVTANTRFWNASGIDVNLDATGLQVDTQSLVSILAGGIAFQTPVTSVQPVRAEENAAFDLYADRATALKNPDLVADNYVVVFKDSVRGLSVGAPIDFRGIALGEVTAIYVDFDPATQTFITPVHFRFYPERLASKASAKTASVRDVMKDSRQRVETMVGRGLRAQLRTGNLLTGQLYVALDFFPDAAKVKLDWSKTPLEVPAVPGALGELQASLGRIAAKIERVPLDEIGGDLRRALKSLDTTLKSTDHLVQRVDRELTPELRTTLEGAKRSLAAVELVLSSEAPLQQGVQETLRDLSRASDSLRVLADYLERNPQALLRGKKEDLP